MVIFCEECGKMEIPEELDPAASQGPYFCRNCRQMMTETGLDGDGERSEDLGHLLLETD